MLARDTIFALASGALPSGVAIIRISGPDALEVGSNMAGALPEHAVAVHRSVRHPASGELLDTGLVIPFHAPRSFTGEDTVEFQIHGSRATVSAVLAALADVENCRQAEAGEFSRRAFENGRMDLTEIEGLSDLIAAETEKQRKLAISQSGGALRDLYSGWREQLITLRASIEADLDFSDEEDVPGSVADGLDAKVSELLSELQAHLSASELGEVVRDGLKVVLIGAPNAGKSTLLNNLAGRDAAIVTDVAGTTRDTIEISMNVDGYLVRITDTAGLRDTVDEVEQEGIRRTVQQISDADFLIGLHDPRQARTDLPVRVDLELQSFADVSGHAGFDMRSDEARHEVLSALREHLSGCAVGEEPLATRSRHRAGVSAAVSHLQDALEAPGNLEIKAEHLRMATVCLEELTGLISPDELLGSIFSQFCIGK